MEFDNRSNHSFAYCVLLSAALKKLELDGECVFFDHRSGETHFLNESGLHILDMISESPIYFNQLLARIQDNHGAPEVEQLPSRLSALLDRLVELGIIVRIPASLAA